jgi:hypothetical protein
MVPLAAFWLPGVIATLALGLASPRKDQKQPS